MKLFYNALAVALFTALSATSFGQQQPNNAGFENWQNVGSSTEEPTNWSGMETGNLCGFCGLGSSQRVFRDGSQVYSGTYSARIESTSYLGNIVNGNITTGEVNAPSTTPADGYNKTVQSNGNFNHPFTDSPDSVVIWAKYNQTGTSDSARISVTLHDAYDVRDPANAASSPYVVARAVKNFQTGGTANWVRISVPFDYTSYPATNVAYVLASITSSYTAGAGSSSATLWVDDMEYIYNPPPPPVASFSASASSICPGESVSFTDNSTSGPTSWAWDFGDGGTSTSQNPSYIFTTPGTWTVELTATNAGGSDIMTTTVTVNALPTVVISGATSVCTGSSTSFTASGATSYSWDNGLGAGAMQTVSPTIPTTYIVTGTANGCDNTEQITITIDTPNSAGTATPISACVSDNNVDILAALSGEDGSGTWSDDDGTGGLTGNIFDASSVSAGTYNFTYTVPANGACAGSSETTQITVTSTVNAGTPTASNDACADNGGFDLYAGISGYTAGGVWADDDGTGALTGNFFDASSIATGTYDFTYTINGGTCGTDTETISITVNPLPSVDAGSDVEICDGFSTPISATGAVTYDWDNGLGAGAGQTVSPAVTTTYTVTGMDGNGCTNTDMVMVTVNPIPNVSAGSDLSICLNDEATLSGSGASTYIWDNGVVDGVPFSQALGTMTYTVTGTDANGCVDTDQVDVTMNTLPTVSVASFSVDTVCMNGSPIALPAGTPAGGVYSGWGVSGTDFDPSLTIPGTHDVYYTYTDGNLCSSVDYTSIEVVLCLGLFDNELISYTVYPNPVSDVITLEFEQQIEVEISVTDDQGRIVFQQSLKDQMNEIKVQDWTPGTYFIELTDINGESVGTHKVIVLH